MGEAKAQTFFSQANPSTQATPTPKKHATMKFDLKPSVHLSGTGKDDVSAGVTARFDHNDPAFHFLSNARVANKDLRLKYTHEVKGKANHLQARFDVDDKTSATVGWNLHGFSAPDYRQFNLKLNYQHDDKWSFEPSYDFGSEAFAARVNHNLDDDNSLSLHYDAHANTGSVEWTNHSLGGPGALRVSATSSLSDNGLKQMPNISASKVFDLEL